MKFEPGKEYRTRGGNEAWISEEHDGSLFGRVRAIRQGAWHPVSWNLSGINNCTFDPDLNLMLPKKKIEVWLWVLSDGRVEVMWYPPAKRWDGYNSIVAAKRVSIEYEDGEFD